MKSKIIENKIPFFVKPFLWSYDISRLNLDKDSKIIITNILNLGDEKAVNWLFSRYSRKDIIKSLKDPLPGWWDKKSLNFWSVIFNQKFLAKKRHFN